MTTTKTTRTPKETQANPRLRALGKGVRVYCLGQDRTYCVPSANGDGSAYQVQAGGETMLYSCPLEATINGATRCRSHLVLGSAGTAGAGAQSARYGGAARCAGAEPGRPVADLY